MVNSQENFLNIIAQSIYDKKGVNILALDVRDVCTMTDFFIIAEGTVDRHVRALANTVEKDLQTLKMRPMHVEGLQEGDWVVLDYGNVVIHLFTSELREKFSIEELWKEGKIVDLEIKLH